jgi:hypothetical protein
MFKPKLAGWLILGGLLWTACSPVPAARTPVTETQVPLENPPAAIPTESSSTPAAYAEAVAQSRKALAGELGVAETEIRLASVEAIDWPDSCLGAPKPNEDCAVVLTPGFLIRLEAGGKTIEMHSNQNGSDVRQAQPGDSGQDPSVKAIALLARLAGLKIEETRTARIEQRDWPDSCLGAAELGEVCASVVTPGYFFELQNGDQIYWLHTNQEISDGRVAGPQNTLIGVRVRLKAAKIAGLPVENLKIFSLEAVDWPNSCMGINTPGRMCLDVITPGYKVVLMDGARRLVFHTNRNANSVAIEK